MIINGQHVTIELLHCEYSRRPEITCIVDEPVLPRSRREARRRAVVAARRRRSGRPVPTYTRRLHLTRAEAFNREWQALRTVKWTFHVKSMRFAPGFLESIGAA